MQNGDESHGRKSVKRSPTKTHPSMSHYLQRFHYISSDVKDFLKHVSLPTWRMGLRKGPQFASTAYAFPDADPVEEEAARCAFVVSRNNHTSNHQKFQVPKMEVLNLIRLFLGWVFPYTSLTYSSLFLGTWNVWWSNLWRPNEPRKNT